MFCIVINRLYADVKKEVSGGGNSNPLQYSRLENPQGQRSLEGVHGLEKELDTTE